MSGEVVGYTDTETAQSSELMQGTCDSLVPYEPELSDLDYTSDYENDDADDNSQNVDDI